MYVFSSAAIAGGIAWAEAWHAMPALVPLVLVQFCRARSESSVLHAAFGERYREYSQGTWF